jgi:hypothetical protein
MPVALPFRGVFAASAVSATCFVCLLTLLKSLLRWECRAPGGGSLRPVATACAVAAVLSVVASAAYFLKARAWSWTFAAAISSKWQPVYFVFVTVERLILGAVVTHAVSAGGGLSGSCSEHVDAVHAVSWMWTCATAMIALSAMGCDVNAEASPALRRCGYGLLALVLVVDGIGSVVWGNPFAGDVSISVANLKLFLNNQLTSCITSQVVIALHFLYVSCRSRDGRGWAYSSLRFELDERGRLASLDGRLTTMTNRSMDSGAEACAASSGLESGSLAAAPLQRAGAARASALRRLRKRWREFQQRQVSRCRVFVIPCVCVGDGGEGWGGDVWLARPAFGLRWLAPLQRLADAHPRIYWGFVFVFLIIPSMACFIFLRGAAQARGISTLFLNCFVCITALGFLSSKRYNLDKVALKHVLLSFRFAIMATLLVMEVTLNVRQIYTSDKHPAEVIAYAFALILFCLSIVMDCSPHLPSAVQIFISVSAHNVVAHRTVCYMSFSAGWMVDFLRIFSIFKFSTSVGR